MARLQNVYSLPLTCRPYFPAQIKLITRTLDSLKERGIALNVRESSRQTEIRIDRSALFKLPDSSTFFFGVRFSSSSLFEVTASSRRQSFEYSARSLLARVRRASGVYISDRKFLGSLMRESHHESDAPHSLTISRGSIVSRRIRNGFDLIFRVTA